MKRREPDGDPDLLPIPPCAVCGMPPELMGTKAESARHREIERQARPTGRTKRDREHQARQFNLMYPVGRLWP